MNPKNKKYIVINKMIPSNGIVVIELAVLDHFQRKWSRTANSITTIVS